MNAERLHAIAAAVLDDLQETNVVGHLEQLVDTFSNYATSPQEASYQVSIRELRSQIANLLTRSKANAFSPVWNQVLESIGARELLAEPLRERIEAIFEQNEITPAVAKQELELVLKDLQKLESTLK